MRYGKIYVTCGNGFFSFDDLALKIFFDIFVFFQLFTDLSDNGVLVKIFMNDREVFFFEKEKN